MKKLLIVLVALGVMLGFGSGAFAAPLVDVIQSPTSYFSPGPSTSAPFYRWYNQDWGWQHNALDTTGVTSALLNISAWDVDAPSEVDKIYIGTSSSGIYLGNLIGNNNAWGYTTFDIFSYLTQIASGLQVFIDIDTTTSGSWAVTLAKSVITLDGATPPPPPPQVPEPATMLLLGIGLAGLAGLKAKKN